MPFDRSTLKAEDKIGPDLLPELDKDEYLLIRRRRDYNEDWRAETASMKYMRPFPVEGQEQEAAAQPPELRRDEAIYFRSIFEYMLLRLHVRDQNGVWFDADPEEPTGTKAVRDEMWAAWGPRLTVLLGARFGSRLRRTSALRQRMGTASHSLFATIVGWVLRGISKDKWVPEAIAIADRCLKLKTIPNLRPVDLAPDGILTPGWLADTQLGMTEIAILENEQVQEQIEESRHRRR